MFLRGGSLPERGMLVEARLRPPLATRMSRPPRRCRVCCAAFLIFPYDFRQALINSLIGVVVSSAGRDTGSSASSH